MANKNIRRRKRASEEDELETAYRHISGYKGKYSKKQTHNHTSVIVAICIALTAVIVCIAAGFMYYIKADLSGIILENISVAGVDVGGMTKADAINAVRTATNNTYNKTPMIVNVLDSQVKIPVNYVGDLDVKGAINAAYKFGNSGSVSKQQQEQKIAMTQGYKVDLAPFLDLNESGIRQILSELGNKYNSTLSQSTYKITGDHPSQALIIQLGVPEYGLDMNQLYQQVLDAYSANHFLVNGECGMIEPEPIDLDGIYEQYYVAPVNASYNKSENTVISEVNGYGFDLEKAKDALSKAKYGSTVEIPFFELKAEVTSDAINAMLFRDTLSTYTGIAYSNKDRDTNLRLACEAINGLVLNPGDVFSYNDTLGERTTARGYRPGPSYAGNKTVQTVGGGICQVSSALYYCALQAELTILLRKNHGFMPSYMPVGLDATVSWGSIDFRFKNTLDYPVRIEATASGGEITVTLIGTDLRDYRVELESDILSTTEYKITYQTMAENNEDGYKDGDYITEPYNGYNVKTYLCKYDSVTNQQLSRELIAHSKYRTRDAVICKIEEKSTNESDSINNA